MPAGVGQPSTKISGPQLRIHRNRQTFIERMFRKRRTSCG